MPIYIILFFVGNHCNETNLSNNIKSIDMEVIIIEDKTFEQMKECFKIFFNQIKDLCGDNQDKEQW